MSTVIHHSRRRRRRRRGSGGEDGGERIGGSTGGGLLAAKTDGFSTGVAIIEQHLCGMTRTVAVEDVQHTSGGATLKGTQTQVLGHNASCAGSSVAVVVAVAVVVVLGTWQSADRVTESAADLTGRRVVVSVTAIGSQLWVLLLLLLIGEQLFGTGHAVDVRQRTGREHNVHLHLVVADQTFHGGRCGCRGCCC